MLEKDTEESSDNVKRYIEYFIKCCEERNVKGFDLVFDKVIEGLKLSFLQVLVGFLHYQNDIDSIDWLCSHMCSKIDCGSDNDKDNLPITRVSMFLIRLKMLPFIDFLPNYCDRIVITNVHKFGEFSPDVKAYLEKEIGLIEFSKEYTTAAIDEFHL
ncbi:hypothetical protein [Dulcicalothrix desertica]|nr:hypothetical protein [Dulcicalothrix desertica]TWH62678.1 hypothetical protein CAL7102_00185 [Dulcicalothrix desertica PCC 7102]